jgi:hypothetical protein
MMAVLCCDSVVSLVWSVFEEPVEGLVGVESERVDLVGIVEGELREFGKVAK